MQLLHTDKDRIGARGRWWDVEQIERAGRRATIVHLSRLADEAAALVAIAPAEPLARGVAPSRLASPRDPLDAARRLLERERRAFGLRAVHRLNGRLHPWQLTAALALARGHSRVLVADAAGTGKTVTAALAIAESLATADSRCLVLVPAHLITQWCHELERRVSVEPIVCDAAGVRRLERTLPAGRQAWSMSGCLVAPLDYVKQPHVLPGLSRLTWDLLVIDEAHNACGDSERHKACDALARRARQVLLMTATPSDGTGARFAVLHHLGGSEPLVMLRHAGCPSGSAVRDRRLRVRPDPSLVALHDALTDYAAMLVGGPRGNTPGMHLLTSLFTRRLLSSVHALRLSLARRLALMDGALRFSQTSLFDEDVDATLAAPSGLAQDDEQVAIAQLIDLARQAEAHERRPRMLERLLDRTDEPALVFTCYADTALWLADRLAERSACAIHGQQPPATIDATVRAFTSGSLRVLIATDIAAEGLNLHARCRRVVHYDLPWRPSTLQQRNGRVDRLGQARQPHSTLLMDDVAAAHAAYTAVRALSDRMAVDEPRTARRWRILADAEVRRARARREPPDPISALPLPDDQTHIIDIALFDRAGATVERRGIAITATEDAATRWAELWVRRRSRALARSLRARARRRMRREHAVAVAILEPMSPHLRQDGLFDRRTGRARAADAAFRAQVTRECRDALARHDAGSAIAGARLRHVATISGRRETRRVGLDEEVVLA